MTNREMIKFIRELIEEANSLEEPHKSSTLRFLSIKKARLEESLWTENE